MVFTAFECEQAIEPIQDIGDLFNYDVVPSVITIGQNETGTADVMVSNLPHDTTRISLSLIDNTYPPFIVDDLMVDFNPGTIKESIPSILSITVPQTVTPDTYDVIVKFKIVNAGAGVFETHELRIIVPPTPTPDFTISLSPTEITIQQGMEGSVWIDIDRTAFNQPIDFTVGGSPIGSGVDTLFNPNPVPGNVTTTVLKLTVDQIVFPDTYALLVKASAGGVQEIADLSLIVVPQLINPWHEVTPLPGGWLMEGVSFTSVDTGWVVGQNNSIFRTTNGGLSWMDIASTGTGNFYDVNFTQSSTGTVVGEEHTVLRTFNYGTQWIDTLKPPGFFNDLLGVHFLDVSNGWVVGRGSTIYKTTDGGDNWEMQTAVEPGDYYDVYFFSQNEGIIVGEGSSQGIILYTNNGGDFWNISTYPNTSVALYDCDLAPGTSYLYAVGRGPSPSNDPIVYQSWGGLNWIEQDLPEQTTELWAVSFGDDQHGWAGGLNHTVYTSDGGQNWFIEHGSGLGFYAMDFLNSSVGYAVGGLGKVYLRN